MLNQLFLGTLVIPFFWKSKVTVISAKLPDGGRGKPYNVAQIYQNGIIFLSLKVAYPTDQSRIHSGENSQEI